MLDRPIRVLLAVAIPALFSGAAVAHTYERCDADGDHCVRITCDHDGDRCWRDSEYSRNRIYGHKGRWECDRDGDRCHYVYEGHRWEPHHWEHDRDDEHDR